MKPSEYVAYIIVITLLVVAFITLGFYEATLWEVADGFDVPQGAIRVELDKYPNKISTLKCAYEFGETYGYPASCYKEVLEMCSAGVAFDFEEPCE